MENNNIPAPRIPVSTYRLQFNHDFRFTDAAELVDYLHELGISDIYASPYFKARKGSPHGYDIVDPSMLNPEIGNDEEYDVWVWKLKKYGMGQIADIVPNHMCCDSNNRWWMDVLENGPSSPYEKFFDIDWNPAGKKLSGKLLIPLLGDQYGKVLENQELELTFEDGAFFINCRDLKLPIVPETSISILQHRLDELRELMPENDPGLTELLSIITALKHLPPVTEKEGDKRRSDRRQAEKKRQLADEKGNDRISERYREKEIVKKRLLALYVNSPEIQSFIDENVAIFNGVKGDPRSFNLLDALITEQVWRPSYWRVATEEINYRRFFDINDTSAIRVENPIVFGETHKLILKLVGDGKVTGLRVDHPDGLYNPSVYFKRLQKECFDRLASERKQGDDEAPQDSGDEESDLCETLQPSDIQYRPFYIVGEKILIKGEKVPGDWPVFGTTGYDFLNAVNGIFVDARNAKVFYNLYGKFVRTNSNFADIVYEKKKLAIQVSLSSEINTLGHYLNRISEKNRHTRDFTLNSLTKVITEVIAFFPVYRTYINFCPVKDIDRQYIEAAVSKAKRRNPAISSSIFDFLSDVLLLRFYNELTEDDEKEWLAFTMRFQQMTAPIMAKGFEDTAFYIYNRLISLNEVGGSPDRFGLTLEAFHGQNAERLKSWPHALIATSTHDTKRSEDVRARINVLSEIPERWRECLTRWSSLNKRKKTIIEGQPIPDRNEECLLYQTLVGAWPLGHPEGREYDGFKARIRDYMIKALREAKINTSWINPNPAYEDGLTSFINAILTFSAHNKFLEEFMAFHKTTAYFGMLNSLSQSLLKIVSPGVPDFYQGTEMWDFSLVDPDNRRPVDFALRRKTLEALKKESSRHGPDMTGFLKDIFSQWETGAIKLYVTYQALNYRKDNQLLFMEGIYMPLSGDGGLADNFCGIARKHGDNTVLAIVPRFMGRALDFTVQAPLGEKIWGSTAIVLPDKITADIFRNLFTGEEIETVRSGEKRVLYLRDIFSLFPVAMLTAVMTLQ